MSLLTRRRALMAASGGESGLPSEYQQVEWIESFGGARIETGIIPTPKSAMYARMLCEQQAASNFLGSRDAASGTDRAFLVASYRSANKFGFMRWGYGVQTISFDTNWHEFYLSPTEARVDGVAYSLDTPKEQTSRISIWLCKEHMPGNASSSDYNIKISSFKFWEDGNIVSDYIPCYRKADGVIGMYDTVTKTFLTNAGTGTFTKGADVN